jgi:hypothetical protein
MLPVEFEPTIPASAWPQTYALDRVAIGICILTYFDPQQIIIGELNHALVLFPDDEDKDDHRNAGSLAINPSDASASQTIIYSV